jgi:Arc/MetJ-type ribon-helix-helix transcriptional regulator
MVKRTIKIMIGIPPTILSQIDDEVSKGVYSSRSALIVEALRQKISKEAKS